MMALLQWAAFYHDHVLVKEPGAESETPWHQDQPYYPVDGFKVREAEKPYKENICLFRFLPVS